MDTEDNIFTHGVPLREWCEAPPKIAPSTFFALPDDEMPVSCKVGRSRVILETKSSWLLRLARQQAEAKAAEQSKPKRATKAKQRLAALGLGELQT